MPRSEWDNFDEEFKDDFAAILFVDGECDDDSPVKNCYRPSMWINDVM